MKGSQLLPLPASRPSMQSLAQGSARQVHGAIPISDYHNHARASTSSSHPSTSFARSAVPQWHMRPPLDELVVASLTPRPRPLNAKQSLLLSESPNDPGSPTPPNKTGRGISDHEYQIRVGKACRVLVDSLPDFMAKGVVDLPDLEPDCQSSSSSSSATRWSAKGLLPSISPFLGQSLLRRQKGKDKAATDEASTFDSLYHPSIAFEFRPPLPHIGIGSDADQSSSKSSDSSSGDSSSTSVEPYHPRHGPTICFNGRALYVASSHLLRHALSALFHDTSLHLESARFEGRSKAGSSWPGISPYIRRHSPQNPSDTPSESGGGWQDKLIIRLRFEGISRVSSAPHTYTVIFKYEFDRETGMVRRHVVDNIQPVPGSGVWARLSNVWGQLSPAGGGGAAPGGGGAACLSKVAGRGN